MAAHQGAPHPDSKEKGPFPDGTALFISVSTVVLRKLFLLELLVFVLELVDTTGRIHQFGLPGIVRVGSP